MMQTKQDKAELNSLSELRDASDFFTFANAIIERFEKSLNEKAAKKKLKLQGEGSCHQLVLKSEVKKNIINEANNRRSDEYQFGVASVMLESAKQAVLKKNQNLVLEKLIILGIVIDKAMGEMQSLIDAELKKQISAQASKGGKARVANSSKQKAKEKVFEYWKKWKLEGKDFCYSSAAEFSRDMFDKFDELESPPQIEKWCTKWKQEYLLS